MATTTYKLDKTHVHYLDPKQNGRATWLDEVRFVEEMIENPLMLDRYGLKRPLFTKMTYKFVMNYAYTVLNLRGKDVQDYMYNTMIDVSYRYIDSKPYTLLKTEKELGYSQAEINRNEKEEKRRLKLNVETYAKRVCYGDKVVEWNEYKGTRTTIIYTPMTIEYSHRALNCWEFLQSVRPQVFTEDIKIYKSEIDEVLKALSNNDLHKILIGYSIIVRAKLFESSRCYWDSVPVVDDETGEVFKRNQNSNGKHWQTPLLNEYCFSYKVFGECNTRSKTLKYELGIEDRRGVAKLYTSVIDEMELCGLLENTSKVLSSNGGYSQAQGEIFETNRHGMCYTIKDFSQGKTKTKVSQSAKTYLKATISKDLQGAYRPTFLELERDEEPIITIDYNKLIHGYVFDMIEYLISIGHSSVKNFNGRIETCKQCGKRFFVYLDGTKGRTPVYCKDCSDNTSTVRRYRKGKIKDVHLLNCEKYSNNNTYSHGNVFTF